MGKATMAKEIVLFFRSHDQAAGTMVLKKAEEILTKHEGALRLSMDRPFLKCQVVGDEEKAEKAVTDIISAIEPLVTFVNRQ